MWVHSVYGNGNSGGGNCQNETHISSQSEWRETAFYDNQAMFCIFISSFPLVLLLRFFCCCCIQLSFYHLILAQPLQFWLLPSNSLELRFFFTRLICLCFEMRQHWEHCVTVKTPYCYYKFQNKNSHRPFCCSFWNYIACNVRVAYRYNCFHIDKIKQNTAQTSYVWI